MQGFPNKEAIASIELINDWRSLWSDFQYLVTLKARRSLTRVRVGCFRTCDWFNPSVARSYWWKLKTRPSLPKGSCHKSEEKFYKVAEVG